MQPQPCYIIDKPVSSAFSQYDSCFAYYVLGDQQARHTVSKEQEEGITHQSLTKVTWKENLTLSSFPYNHTLKTNVFLSLNSSSKLLDPIR